MKQTALISALLAGLSLSATGASALTVPSETIDFGTSAGTGSYTEDGFTFDSANLNESSNCPGGGACLMLNNGAYSDAAMTSADGAFYFHGLSYAFNSAGGGNSFTVFADVGPLITIYAADGLTGTLSLSPTLISVQLSLSHGGGGNVRIDDIMVSGVPLPAAGGMLLAGVGLLAGLRRRKGA
ncbi:VPLPA-CTERM sorting domain-containing protein [Litorivita sp. NS0012-18]|uniref:VPLPA-CTERM sorting domain-containing protein n=1 Tax=Litorivita sp. NS0012-18 TaxID=3127655 RepID=UPI0031072E58